MSTATLPSRVLATELTSSVSCETCTSTAMTISPNPYFGTGLAVHRHIAICDSCGAVAFVPEPAAPGIMERLVAQLRTVFGGTARA